MHPITSKHPATPRRSVLHAGAALRILVLAGLLLSLSHPRALPAQANTKGYQTTFATILYENEKDLFAFTRNIDSGLSFLSQSPEKNPLLIRSRVDRIVQMVGALLDMRPADLHFSITIVRTQPELDAAFHALGMMGAAPPAFYNHGSKTITIALDSITDRILAHEIAHAIICTYFGTPPPVRTQEVLAQYVDRHLEE